MTFVRLTPVTGAIGAALLVLIAYANHFDNGFHFDDSHAIEDNTYVRSIHNIPRYFTDATTFSVLPLNQSYRPLLQTTFAIDYWLGGGYRPMAFQIDTFVWYLLLLLATGWLYRLLAGDSWTAVVAVSIYALHPVCAETVNYIVQRGDLLSTLAVVMALLVYLRWPSQRRFGWYLIPFVAGTLVKPPALVMPALLALYLWVFERRPHIVRAVMPSATVAVVMAWWLAHMTPATATTGSSEHARYLWTQPFVALRYFSMFFVPAGLSADNDWGLVSGPSDGRVVVGVAFAAALLTAIVVCRRKEWAKPVAFGLGWFVITLLPTSLTPLAEVANDHRMFFPFVGLSLAVTVVAGRILQRVVRATPARSATAAAVVVIILLVESVAVYGRNQVWHSEESLWRDVTEKSPGNGRGWMNYGVTLMARTDYAGAVAALNRALPLTPNYHLLEINLGVAYGGLGRPVDAEPHFLRAISLQPTDWRSHLHYARWLASVGRGPDALAHARLSRELNPADVDAIPIERAVAQFDDTPEYYLALSLADYQMGRYRECIASAERALILRPLYAEAWNNVAAAHNALGEWKEGIAAGEEALNINPSLQIARNNVNFARQHLQSAR